MQITEYCRFDIIGLDILKPRDDVAPPQLFLYRGLLLIVLIGVIAPLSALLSGVTGQVSAVFVAIVLGVYVFFLFRTRSVLAGWAAAIPVLATFNMAVPLTSYAGPIRVELMPVDVFLLSFGLFAVVSEVDSFHPHVRLVCRLSALFAGLAVFVGIVTFIGEYSLTGAWFGINQIRYPLIVFASVAIVYRFTFRYLVALLMTTFSIHITYAVLESLRGRSFGLGYFGDMAHAPGIRLGTTDLFGLTFTTGLFPGGFIGPSRALLAVLCLLFPVALYWVVYRRTQFLPAYMMVIGMPLIVLISRSDTGTGVILLSVVGVILTVILYDNGFRMLSVNRALMLSSVAIACFSLLIWTVLTSSVFNNSHVRVAQYRVAWEIFMSNPLTGIGGLNFASAVEMIRPESEAASAVGVHNTFLAYLSELGIVGFLLYSGITVIVYTKGLGVYLSSHKKAIVSGMILIGLIAFHIYSSLTLVYHRPNIMMIYWSYIGGSVTYFCNSDFQ